ncbi:MAG: TraR/DksA family transcriptional regulator [Sphingobacteriales bacterium]|jgi:RNA polymerase-binding transcription factor DksA|nr:MAG: TraR/DksA family transcriptional regulator [Sphingobacteriales bacterium]
MAVKKKAAKPAKKAPAKPAAKKAAVKKPAAPAKKAVVKKAAPAKKAAPKAKPAAKPIAKPIAKPAAPALKKPAPAPVAKPAPKPVAKPAAKPAPVVKPEAKKPEPLKPMELPKPVNPNKPGFKPVTKQPVPIPKKTVVAPKPTKVVMPDIKTKSTRKYEPDFTKSVLDQPLEQYAGPSMRYSDGELVEFREIIQKKLDAAKKELTYLQGLITRKDEMGGDNDDARYMTMEDGSMSMEREQLSQMASRQITFIDHLEKAMMRIENKTYGVCRVTGKLIDKARLRAVPHATLSIEAKQMMSK